MRALIQGDLVDTVHDLSDGGLIAAAADKVKIPMLASGGIADARGLVAALALGVVAYFGWARFTRKWPFGG